MHKVENTYFLLIKKKRDSPRQGVAQGRVYLPLTTTFGVVLQSFYENQN